MANENVNLRDLLASVISGTTINIVSASATDMLRAIIDEEKASVRISGISGSSGEAGTSGTSGTSGESGLEGTSGTSGIDGAEGPAGASGTQEYTMDTLSDSTDTAEVNTYYRLSGTTTLNLPSATGSGNWILVKNLHTGALSCTITADGTDLIDGEATYALTVSNSVLLIDAESGPGGAWDIN